MHWSIAVLHGTRRRSVSSDSKARDLPSAPVPPDTVSWYRAEGDASDFVGGNHGTLMNGTTFTAGKVGQAFHFDGIDDRVEVRKCTKSEPDDGGDSGCMGEPPGLNKDT